MSDGKIIHYYRPHIFNHPSGIKLHRLTYCAVENKGAYKSSVHFKNVNCKLCLKRAQPKEPRG